MLKGEGGLFGRLQRGRWRRIARARRRCRRRGGGPRRRAWAMTASVDGGRRGQGESVLAHTSGGGAPKGGRPRGRRRGGSSGGQIAPTKAPASAEGGGGAQGWLGYSKRATESTGVKLGRAAMATGGGARVCAEFRWDTDGCLGVYISGAHGGRYARVG